MRNTVASVFFIPLLTSIGFADSSGMLPPRCEVTDLREVFAHPLQSDGKMFCGRVFMFRSQIGAIRFYVDKAQADSDPYTIALIPMSRPDELRAAKESTFATIGGRLEIDAGCMTGSEPGQPELIVKCTPIKQPVYIELFSASLD